MKKHSIYLFASVILCGLMVSIASAQDTKAAPRRGANVEQRLERLDQELKLTAEQKAKLKTYFEEQNKKMQALRDDTSLTREQRQEKTRAARGDLDKEMKSVLTSDQFTKWEKQRDTMKEEARKKGKQQGKTAAPKTESTDKTEK